MSAVGLRYLSRFKDRERKNLGEQAEAAYRNFVAEGSESEPKTPSKTPPKALSEAFSASLKRYKEGKENDSRRT